MFIVMDLKGKFLKKVYLPAVIKMMKSIRSLAIIIFIILLSGQIFPGLTELPPFAAKIEPFALNVYKNEKGYWEAEFKYGIKLVYISAGEFLMGSSPGETGREANEGPVHRVYLDGYWIGKYEITQEIWQTVMGSNPSHFKNAGKQAPVENVSWFDAQRFLDKLGDDIGTIFTLPSEAQWEKACRAGSCYSRYGPLNNIAWCQANAGPTPRPVGTKMANNYGLYDMLGNVWEWTNDWYQPDYYSKSPYKNPPGPASGKRKVVRGGSFMHGPSYNRCAHRNNYPPRNSILRLGFRIVRPDF